MDPFRYEPLENPATCIRLLKRIDSTRPDGLLSFRISAWPVDIAPQYNAISYTWGDLIFETISIDRSALKVRRNCHHALVQCLGYDQNAYVWIDSICINQSDVSEKTHQVARMHAIYANAQQVLACVGHHGGGSEYLATTCRAINRSLVWQRYTNDYGTQHIMAELLEEWTGLSRDEVATRIQLSLLAFAQRPYWDRLWILQEVVAGAENLLVLCGMSSIAWAELNAIDAVLIALGGSSEEYLRSPLNQLVQLSSEILSSEGTLPLRGLMQQLANAKCVDPRDRVYGLLALIDWEDSGLEPIVPDYARSAWDIALILLPALSPYDCRLVMSRLELYAINPRVEKLLREREAPHSQVRASTQQHVFHFQRMAFLRLSRDDQGVFRVTLDNSERDVCVNPTEYLAAAGLTESLEESPGTNTELRPQRLYLETQLIGLMSNEALSGDFVAFSPLHDTFTCLIVRHTKGQSLDVVGTGYLLIKEYRVLGKQMRQGIIPSMDTSEMPGDALFQAGLQLIALPEDLMVLNLYDRHEKHSIDLRRFLTVRPIVCYKDAAKIVPWRRHEESEAYRKLYKAAHLRQREGMEAELSEPWKSAEFISEDYARKSASLNVVFRCVEFTLQAERASLVAQVDEYDVKAEIFQNPGLHDREVVIAAFKALREGILQLFAERLRALAPVPCELRTLQDAVRCSKFSCLLGRDRRVQTVEQPRGPTHRLLAIQRAALKNTDDIRRIQAGSVGLADRRPTIFPIIKGMVSLSSGRTKAFFKPLIDNGPVGYDSAVGEFEKVLVVHSKLSIYEEELRRLRIPKFLGIVTSFDDTAALGHLTEWIEASALAKMDNWRRRDHRPAWKEQIHQSMSFLHERGITLVLLNEHSVLIDRDDRAWLTHYWNDWSWDVDLEPNSDKKKRDLEALDELFEEQ